MKQFNKAISLIIILTLSIGMIFTLCACEPEPPDPVYEIRLYDDDWQELEKKYYSERDKYNYSYSDGIIHEFEYDGNEKGFNAIAYKDGQEFARYSYKEKEPDPLDIFAVSTVSRRFDSDNPFERKNLISKGLYAIEYSFDTLHSNSIEFETPIGKMYLNDLPRDNELCQRTRIKII